MRKKGLYFSEDPRSMTAEAYRSLRTNIMAALAHNPCRTILVTSAMPREGKTTTVVNMGAVLAQANKRVLLVDTDLRSPMLHHMLGVEAQGGITGLVADLLAQPIVQGTLSQLSLGDIFYLLRFQERTGVLKLENNAGCLEASFHTGEIVGLHCHFGELRVNQAVNAKVQALADSPADDIPDWRYFLSQVTPETAFHFRNAEAVTINGGSKAIHWGMLLDNLPGLHQIPGIVSRMNAYIQPTQREGLFLLPCGKLPEQPAEMLGSLIVRELFQIFGHYFNIVLLDSPPVTPVTDASLMVSYLDGVIFVLRSRAVDRHIAINALEQLRRVEANILGVVLNDTDMQSDHYYYSHYKRYAYPYGSGRK